MSDKESREIRETYLDGTVRVHRAVKLKNATNLDVAFLGDEGILREQQVALGKRPDGTTRYGTRKVDVVIRAGETVLVAEEIANVLVRMRCAAPGCGKPWQFGQPGVARNPASVCIDLAHARVVVGGLAPNLVILDDEDRVVVAPPAPNLEPEPPPAFDANDLHRRVMARVGGGK